MRKSLVLFSDGSKRWMGDRELSALSEYALRIERIGPRKVKVVIPPSRITGQRTFESGQKRVAPYDYYTRQERLSRERTAAGVHTEGQWLVRVEFFGWKCRYCGKTLTPQTLTKDHQIPLSERGTQWPVNLVPACQSCNSSKGNRRWRSKSA